MNEASHAARLVAVDNQHEGREQSARARAFMARLEQLGMHQMSRRRGAKTLGISEDAWWGLRTGQPGYDTTIDKAEAGLKAWLIEHGEDLEEAGEPPAAADETFSLTVTIGALDVAVTAKGRPEDAGLVREQVRQLVTELMARED